MNTTTSFLPFKDNHIIEIDSLDPELIKKSTKKMKRDRKNISHTSILNHIAKSLGIKGGFQGYLKTYVQDLLPFLEKHNLNKRKDLFTLQKPGFDCKVLRIKRQQLSERIFNSGLAMPEKVFTGYNFDYASTIDDKVYRFSNTLKSLKKIVPEISNFEDIDTNISAIKDIKNTEIAAGNKTIKLQDIMIGGYFWELYEGFNLLGDLLIKPNNNKYVHKLYHQNEQDKMFVRTLEKREAVLQLFNERISNQESGWVTIIPFNENLVFLKGENGSYDFIFKNQKNTTFTHEVFNNKLKISDVPYFIDDYSFDRWKYFEYKGWIELDEHESERHYYINEGTQLNYPGQDIILRSYLTDSGFYESKKRSLINTIPYDNNFYCINNLDHRISVTNPVSIEQFYEFLRERPDYRHYRSGENIDNVNADCDLTLPVSCTWYDSLAFCTWYKEKYNLPVRLLTIDEYKALRLLAGEVTPNYERSSESGFYDGFQYFKDLIFSNNGQDYQAHPPYMSHDEFDSLELRFKNNLNVLETKEGLKFVDSNDFSEWNMEASCIRSGNLKGFFGNDKILRQPPLDCTGKYKHQKIGFRLCLDIKHH